MHFINRLYTKLIFSDAPNLNIGAYDMGEGQITIKLTEDSVKRLKTATRTIGSLEIFVPVEADVEIAKDSPVRANWLARYKANGYIGGSVTFYDDTNTAFVGTEPSLSISSDMSSNGSDPKNTFKLSANFLVNTQALAGF